MIALIAAYAKHRVIGKDGCIPWKIKGEQRRFKDLTIGNAVVMGRKSFEEIGRALPGRKLVVVSRTIGQLPPGCILASSLQEAIQLSGDSDIYISGGERLYQEALPLADRIYITEVDLSIDGDTYFPYFNENLFIKTSEEVHEGEINYTYLTYVKKRCSQCAYELKPEFCYCPLCGEIYKTPDVEPVIIHRVLEDK